MMFAVLSLLGMAVVDLFESRRRPEAENMFLHHQLNIAMCVASTWNLSRV